MSDPSGTIEHVFDNKQVHDYWEPPETPESRSLLEELAVTSRRENQAAARRLRIIGDLFELRRAERGENAEWAVDTWAAVGAEIAAALRISLGKAGSQMNYGLAMHRLPAVAAVFEAGDIDMNTFRTLVYRTDLITDEAAMAEVDRILAARAARWPSMTHGRLIREVDRIVITHDRDAKRRTRERARDRDVTIWDDSAGLSDLSARLFTADAQVLDQRLDALAATVCPNDPRTAAQRRADALGALAANAERLMCRCESPDCAAAVAVQSPIVIHVVAEQSSLRGDSELPGYLMGTGALIPAELLRDIAAKARLRPLVHPADCPAEPRYRPSRTLADFVRARDLTCRAPGCDRPAIVCDLDHTVPYDRDGPTHASNLKCLCRFHHLVKTFWGWKDRQLRDGTVIWELPDGQTYVTTPGSAWLLPSLMAPTGEAPVAARSPESGNGTAMMPLRQRTRTQNRAHSIATERAHNRRRREHRNAKLAEMLNVPAQHDPGDDPPF